MAAKAAEHGQRLEMEQDQQDQQEVLPSAIALNRPIIFPGIKWIELLVHFIIKISSTCFTILMDEGRT